jgi:hypothetical protein
MFECKIKRIRQRATKETGNLEELKKDIEDGVVAGLIQIDNVIEEIKRKNDQFKEFSDVNRFIPIILFLDEFDFANSLMMRNFINEVYQTKKGEAFRNQYHILDIEEFENLLPTIKIGSGRGLLRSLLQHKEKEQFSSFTDFFYYRFKKGVRVNHFLRERFDQTWKEAISFIFNKDIRDVELPTRKR